MIGRVLDTSSLVDFATQRTRYVEAVVWMHDRYVGSLIIPAPALTAARAQISASAIPVLDVLVNLEVCVVLPLDENNIPGVADTLKAAGSYAPEAVTAASVVHAARARKVPVCTSNSYPLRALWAGIEIDPIP